MLSLKMVSCVLLQYSAAHVAAEEKNMIVIRCMIMLSSIVLKAFKRDVARHVFDSER